MAVVGPLLANSGTAVEGRRAEKSQSRASRLHPILGQSILQTHRGAESDLLRDGFVRSQQSDSAPLVSVSSAAQ